MKNKNITWMPEEGEKIEGKLVHKLENIGKYNNNLYKIKCGDIMYSVWGKKQLDALMELTEEGDRIVLTYLGLEKVNEFHMKKFELEILNGN